MNKCYMCKQFKAAKEFYPDDTRKSGLSNRCKSCGLAYFRANKLRKREIVRKSMERPEYISKKRVYRKKYYQNNPYPEKALARSILHTKLRSGEVKRKPCQVCGKPNAHAHHPDYSKPLKVQWLCRDHHEAVHHP